jgi:glycosyltransferase involved in cell wall biosynthesis
MSLEFISEMKIAFVYYLLSPFVRQDCEILSRYFRVEAVNYRRLPDVLKMVQHIRRTDITFSWFASGHSFIAVIFSKLLRKKSVVVAGGYDVAFAPEIDYGQYTLGWQKRLYADFVLKHADVILAVSEFTRIEVLARTTPKRLMVVYNAIDTDKFFPRGEKENLVLTVASGQRAIELKGLDTFVKAAPYLPDAKFIVLGLSDNDMKALESIRSSNNVELHGYVEHKELIDYYQKARVYCQLSYRESFGVALAEAMSCGCVPVATGRGALPEVVGDAGFYANYGDPESTAQAIETALKMALTSGSGSKARERIVSAFPKSKREKMLVEIIKDLAGADES